MPSKLKSKETLKKTEAETLATFQEEIPSIYFSHKGKQEYEKYVKKNLITHICHYFTVKYVNLQVCTLPRNGGIKKRLDRLCRNCRNSRYGRFSTWGLSVNKFATNCPTEKYHLSGKRSMNFLFILKTCKGILIGDIEEKT